MSKFDTVINNLRHHIFCLKEVHGFKDPHAFDDYETAIRVLEAAGKVDKDDFILTIRAMMMICQTTDDDEKSLNGLLEFLSALPDKEPSEGEGGKE